MSTTPPEEPTRSLPAEPAAEPDPAQQTDQTSGRSSAAARLKRFGSGISKTTPALVLAGVLLLAAGLFGGNALTNASDGGGPRDRISRAGGQFPGGAPGAHDERGGERRGQDRRVAPGPGQEPGDVTVGTVTSVNGTSVTIKTVDGKTVKVTVGTATRVTINKIGTVSGLDKGPGH